MVTKSTVTILILIAYCLFGQSSAMDDTFMCEMEADTRCRYDGGDEMTPTDFYACVQNTMETCLDESDNGQRVDNSFISTMCTLKTADVEVCYSSSDCQLVSVEYYECTN